MPRVTFLPSGAAIRTEEGETILDAAIRAEEFVTATCGGKGVCGKCRVTVESGEVRQEDGAYATKGRLAPGEVLACRSRALGDLVVRLPDTGDRFRAWLTASDELLAGAPPRPAELSPLARTYSLELPPPSLDDPTGDYERVKRALDGVAGTNLTTSLAALNDLGAATRSCGWTATAAVVDRGCVQELVKVAGCADSVRPLGLAVDLGTTTIVAYLVDLATGAILGAATALNRQIASGDDVISRIVFAGRPGGLARLQKHAVATINDLIDELVRSRGVPSADILAVSVSGNTVMTHLLLGLNPQNIRIEPYIPVATDLPVIPSSWIGLATHPRAGIFLAPCNAAYVGGDITAGVLYTGLHRSDALTLFVDVGTNGEMVLGGREFLLTGACSAGPAFEGGGIEHGMRAVPGAIDSVTVDPVTFRPTWTTIENRRPRGICGSGLVDLLAALFLSGVLDARGKFADGLPEEIVREGTYGREYVVAPAAQTAIGRDIVLSEADIDTLVRSKGAIFAGIQSLLKKAGLPLSAIDQILIAGGFGRHLDVQHTIQIGMFPDLPVSKYRYVGNSSLGGSYLTLLSAAAREEIKSIARGMTYVDFSSSPLFFDEYQSALFLPHTDERLFPSAARWGQRKGART